MASRNNHSGGNTHSSGPSTAQSIGPNGCMVGYPEWSSRSHSLQAPAVKKRAALWECAQGPANGSPVGVPHRCIRTLCPCKGQCVTRGILHSRKCIRTPYSFCFTRPPLHSDLRILLGCHHRHVSNGTYFLWRTPHLIDIGHGPHVVTQACKGSSLNMLRDIQSIC